MAKPPDSPLEVLSALNLKKSVRPNLEPQYACPRDSVEESLAEIWSEVLRVDTIGRNDNLFSLGGDSISIVRIISRIYQRFGVEILLAECFDSPTVSELATLIKTNSGSPSVERDDAHLRD
jgi:acyl carrier protein